MASDKKQITLYVDYELYGAMMQQAEQIGYSLTKLAEIKLKEAYLGEKDNPIEKILQQALNIEK